jgi:hypothetical protein
MYRAGSLYDSAASRIAGLRMPDPMSGRRVSKYQYIGRKCQDYLQSPADNPAAVAQSLRTTSTGENP